MTFRSYLALMAIATILCSIAWVMVLFTVDPSYANGMGFIFFYIGFFLVLFGLLSMISCAIFYKRSDHPLFRLVEKSFRVASFSAGTATVLLVLQGLDLIRLWTFFVFLSALLCFLGFIYLSKPSAHSLEGMNGP